MYRTYLVGVVVTMATVGVFGSGCSTNRALPINYIPEPPQECKDVIAGVDSKTGQRMFIVDKLPEKNTTTGQINVWLAQEGATRENEHSIAKTCANYALRTAGVMADAPTPKGVSNGPVPESDPKAVNVKTRKSPKGDAGGDGAGAGNDTFVKASSSGG